MKRLLLFLVALLGFTAAKSQFVYKIKADSVLITNDSCTAELIIENSTKNVKGFLVNKGNGRTEFRRATQLTDSSFIMAGDTIVIRGTGMRDSAMWKNDGTLTGNRVIKTGNYDLFFRTPIVTTETWPGAGHVYIGDSAYVPPYVRTANGDGQANAGLIISKTKTNNSENVDLLTMTTSDVGTKNGWLFQNYTNSIGKVCPRMYTFSNVTSTGFAYGNSGYLHDAFAKSITSNAPVMTLRALDYDSANISGNFNQKILHRTLYSFVNGNTPVFLIDSNENIGINTLSPKAKLHIEGSVNGIQEFIKLPSSQTQANPIIQIQNSNGDTLIEARAQNVSGVNIFIGRNSGVNSTGSRNTSLGDSTLASNTTAGSNTAVGFWALKSNTTGNYNTAVGSIALRNNTTGSQNSAVGEDCLSYNTTGIRNTSIGGNALKYLNGGNDNTAVGASAGQSLNSGSDNTIIGTRAGYCFNSNTGSTGSYNTIVGTDAGFYPVFVGPFTGQNNTMIGYRAGYYSRADTGNVLIGYTAGSHGAVGNNKLYIATSSTTTPLVYGEFDNNILATSGKFGIRTKTPEQALHVAGQVKIDTLTSSTNGTDSVLAVNNGLIKKAAFGYGTYTPSITNQSGVSGTTITPLARASGLCRVVTWFK